jgi:hypothetical protein
MILFTILILILILLTLFTILAISIGGTVAIVLFGDVFVCGFLIVWLIRLIYKRRKEKKYYKD